MRQEAVLDRRDRAGAVRSAPRSALVWWSRWGPWRFSAARC